MRLDVEPEDVVEGFETGTLHVLEVCATCLCDLLHPTVKLTLDVRYPDEYPDVLPELELTPAEGDFDDAELDHLRSELQTVVCVFIFNNPLTVLSLAGVGPREPGNGNDIHTRVALT